MSSHDIDNNLSQLKPKIKRKLNLKWDVFERDNIIYVKTCFFQKLHGQSDVKTSLLRAAD